MAIIASSKRERPKPETIHDIYCDESSQTRHRYMLMGGLICPSTHVVRLDAYLAEIRLPELPRGELKWGSVSNKKLEAYRRVVDSFFGHELFRGVEFHSTVIDTWGQDHQKFGDGDRDKTFNKELYQLATKFARLYPEQLFHLYPDERETAHRPGELRDILNFGRRKIGTNETFRFGVATFEIRSTRLYCRW